MSSPANISQTFAWYYRFDRDPDVFEKMLNAVAKLTPKDVDAFAKKHFVAENRAVLTLSYQAPEKAKLENGK